MDWLIDAWDWIKSAAQNETVKSVASAVGGAVAGAGASAMFGGMGGGPPVLPEIPSLPKSVMETGRGTEASTAVKTAEDKMRAAMASGKGRGATLLTGPLGIEDGATVQRKMLLGV